MPRKANNKQTSPYKIFQSKDFLCDISKEGMLYAAIIRSPEAKGKITNINIKDLPEDYYLFTARDVPNSNIINTLDLQTKLFCIEKVHYIGEPIGIIVGPSKSKVRELVKEIQITFDITSVEDGLENIAKEYNAPENVLPEEDNSLAKDSAVADIVDMMNIMPSLDELPKTKNTNSYTHPEQIPTLVQNIKEKKESTNKILSQRIIKTGLFQTEQNKELTEEQLEKILKQSPHIIKGTYQLEETPSLWNEVTGAFCYMDGKKLTVLSPTQWPAHLHSALKDALGLDDNHIIIKKTKTQKTNKNGTWKTSILAVQTALASFLTKKPVKLLLTKEEQKLYIDSDVKVNIEHQTAINENGKIESMIVNIDVDVGIQNPFAAEIVDKLAISACGVYSAENIYINCKAIQSQNPPTSIFPEKTDSHAFFAIENHILKITEELNIIPHEIRDINLNKTSKNQKSPFILNLNAPKEILKNLIIESDFKRKYSTYKLNSKFIKSTNDNPLFTLPQRGIGIAYAFDGSGYYGTNIFSCEQKIETTLDINGQVTINAPTPSDSIAIIWKKTAAEILETNPEAVHIVSEFTEGEIPDLPENIYNNISIMTHLLKKSCAEIKRKRFHQALPIVSKKTITPAMKKKWNKELFTGSPFHTTSFGSAIIEVELNPNTYELLITNIWIAINCGEILSLKFAENTIRLAVQNELQKLIKNDILSYPLPKIFFEHSKDDPGQIGSLIHKIIPAAFSSAVSQTILSSIDHLPITQEDIYNLSLVKEEKKQEETTKQKEETSKEESE